MLPDPSWVPLNMDTTQRENACAAAVPIALRVQTSFKGTFFFSYRHS